MALVPEVIWSKIIQSGSLQEDDAAIIYYDLDALKVQLDFLTRHFQNKNVLHTVAIKTNPHPKILKFIIENGYGLEAASFDEVLMAIKSGCAPHKISYNSPVKTLKEIQYCLENLKGIQLNANSLQELQRIPKHHDLQLGLRINPLVNANTSEIYNVSGHESKFGVAISHNEEIIQAIVEHNVSCLHVHVGSQVSDFIGILAGIESVWRLAEDVNDNYQQQIKTINIGGGLYSGKNAMDNHKIMADFASAVQNILPQLFENYNIITEYGQWTHRFNGCAFSKVEYINPLENKDIAYIHLGGDFFVREIYTDQNNIQIGVIAPKSHEKNLYDIAGPLCYNGDYLAKNIELAAVDTESVLYLNDIGANTYGLWSRHCSRSIPKFIGKKNEEIVILSERYNPFENYGYE